MIKIRIENDITLRVTVTRQGKAETFDLKNVKLMLRSALASVQLDYTATDNVLTAIWLGSEQKKTGIYTVTLVEDYGDGNRNTVDSVGCFALVARSSEETGALTGDQIVDLDLDVSVPANGLSAYEIALLNGYVGTEEEWLASLSADSKEAAAKANTATTKAIEATEAANDAAKEAATQGDYAKEQAGYAKEQGDYANQQAENASVACDKALSAAELAELFNKNPPKIKNGTWWVYNPYAPGYDKGAYVDTEYLAQGGISYPTFSVSDDDMCLYMTYDETAGDVTAHISFDEETGQLVLTI